MAALVSLIEKTGGPEEKTAFNLLQGLVDQAVDVRRKGPA
jgi:hypothetical protein